MMTRLDRGLLAFLGVGVWVLVAVTLGSSTLHGEAQEGVTRSQVIRIVEDCTVSGTVTGSVSGEVYLYSDDYGSIESGSIENGSIVYAYISC